MKTIITNIGILATPQGRKARKGREQADVRIYRNASLEIEQGRIAAIHKGGYLKENHCSTAKVIDAKGALVTPGLVDSHTHLVFAGWRQRELAQKLKGCSYLDILSQGGGILYSVEKTREASLAELVAAGKRSLAVMLAHGTTTCEAKSGYGLNIDDEIKSLTALRELAGSQPVEIVPTFMGAHAVPPEYKKNKEDYIKLICEGMIPAVAASQLAKFCDVFCEEGVFSLAESETILECGRRYGLAPKIHADEITQLGGAELAGKIGAVSAEHLIHAGDTGLASMAAAGTIAVLLPGTSFYLNESFARARAMIDAGIPVAVATDFNPGSCPTESLQLPMNIACLKYRLTPEEVLTAVTLNAAAAIGLAEDVGSIEEGKQADLVIWKAPDLDFIYYHWGTNLVDTVVKKGEVVVTF